MTTPIPPSRTMSAAARAPALEPDDMPPTIARLNPEQQQAFEKFRSLITDAGLYTPASDIDGKITRASHDNTLLLRFLRARQYDPEGALTQFTDTEKWRKDIKIDDAYDNLDLEQFLTARRVYPQWIGRRDNRGIPVYVYYVSHLRSSEISDYTKAATLPKGLPSPKLLKLYAIYESLIQFILPACSRLHPEGAVPCTSNIVDVSKVSLWQFWNLKQHMQDASTLATAHYPETLDRIFIVGAPSFFSTVWGWIKKWFDPITVSKIFILAPNEVKPTLERFIDIKNIPKQYGGELDWEFGQPPNLDEPMKGLLGKLGEPGGWTDGPIRFVEGDGETLIKAFGTEKGKPRTTVFATIPSPRTTSVGEELATAATATKEADPTTQQVSTSEGATAPVAPVTLPQEELPLADGGGVTAVNSAKLQTTHIEPTTPAAVAVVPEHNTAQIPAGVLAPNDASQIAEKSLSLQELKQAVEDIKTNGADAEAVTAGAVPVSKNTTEPSSTKEKALIDSGPEPVPATVTSSTTTIGNSVSHTLQDKLHDTLHSAVEKLKGEHNTGA
jgi:hypothetical protein